MSKILVTLFACVMSTWVVAQEKVYRCGSEYTNNVSRERLAQCTLITTGNVTVVPAIKSRAADTPRPEYRRDLESRLQR